MRILADMANRLRQDEDGAAMVEYSVLIGIITAATIAVIVIVGGWTGLQWDNLCAALPGAACP